MQNPNTSIKDTIDATIHSWIQSMNVELNNLYPVNLGYLYGTVSNYSLWLA